jgi:hypothetical protein
MLNVYPKIVMLRPDLIVNTPYIRESRIGDGRLSAPSHGVLVAFEAEGAWRRAWWLHRHDRLFAPNGPYATRMPADAVYASDVPGLLDAAAKALAVDAARAREGRP